MEVIARCMVLDAMVFPSRSPFFDKAIIPAARREDKREALSRFGGKAVNEAQNNGVNATHLYTKREIYVKIRQREDKQMNDIRR